MFTVARLLRPCVCRLSLQNSLTTLSTSKTFNHRHKSSSLRTPQLLQQHERRPYTQHYHNLSSKSGNDKSDLTKDIEELKVMFKDDPQLEIWLKELDNKSTEPDTTTELDREMLRYNIEEFYQTDNDDMFVREYEEQEVKLPISTERGKQGVFDIEELVELLRTEGMKDVCVIKVPAVLAYADYLVITTGRNLRHIKAAAHYVNWFFKQKRSSKDPPTCLIEGLESTDWLAMDIGNIVLHLMLHDAREMYDIETLWTVGPEYDDKISEEEKDMLTESFDFSTHKDNLLTLSKQVEYVFEEKKESSRIEEKYMKVKEEQQDMDSVTDWHSITRK